MDKVNAEIVELFKFVCKNYKRDANNIFDSMEFLLESIRDTNKSIKKTINPDGNSYEEMISLIKYGQEIENVEKILCSYLDSFAQVQVPEDIFDESDNGEEDDDDERAIPNYENYKVDAEVPHLLSESFTHKKICGFFLCNKKYVVADWKATLVKVCEILYDKDPALFRRITNSGKFTGRKRRYFSTTGDGEFYQKLKNANIYVWNCHSANRICNLIRMMLLEYNISSNGMYIYLRADYTALHSTVEDITISDPNENIKIGKFVRDTMHLLSSKNYRFDQQMLVSLLNKDETKRIFGIGLPFFKEIKRGDNISEVIKDKAGYNRYWKDVFDFNGRKYVIVSQWEKRNADRFNNWLNSLSGISKIIG